MKKVRALLIQLPLWIYFIISIYPLLWMISYSLKNNDEIFVTNPFGFPTNFRIENYVAAWSQFNIPRYFTNSLVVSTISTLLIIILSLMFSFAISRLRWRFREGVRLYMTIGMFMPLQVIMIPLAILVRDLHLTNTYGGLIVPYVAIGLPFSCLVFYGFMKGIPGELEESACMDGANVYRMFLQIIVPVVTPAVATVAIFQFLNNWNEFLLAYILISDEGMKTLPLGLLFFQGQYSTDWGGMGAVMTMASLPMVIVYLFFSEQVERAMTVGSAVKG
ncbi:MULTISPECIES: carbohydrate ABC transporter permease [Paenibacillus]|jgi:raffinose/stachyose/melibiose transport system permease protein|uniref:Carbohydrate ABC transporter permease n=1 Tax=Paenibacillus odorifer TaxID=189426 RepID=A0A1R0YVI6_9BACL|nr:MULTISPECIES: carbohydrate ABC transporter permease [Paenibacillus]AIQ72839.1 sugar ABC transporter permease [Paenibacillus odorifer]AWV32203.1 carbohydrate ABC transporter permease [Paenibacillus odorifer]ETT60298.1 sugar ABC transporter permease [Paenibacillus sp. FSL H8-237]MDH6425640.1 raffinose/stachyose/melibiose transport system permease protein [Paenibacillus sp. PastH-4]MDH6441660.1 raffinose/stachyose/melibiose transport system permease protein [Paenibacillus sp. PastF-4]